MSQLVDIIDARPASCAMQLDKNWFYQLICGVLEYPIKCLPFILT